jgi:predicted RNA-binding protein associated with RNAse of E/G family
MGITIKTGVITLIMVTSLVIFAMWWSKHQLRQVDPEWQKIEALTDAVNNGLITPEEYETKVTELVGGAERDYTNVHRASPAANGVWTAADTWKVTALSDALANGAITREQFDAKVREFARGRQRQTSHSAGSGTKAAGGQ